MRGEGSFARLKSVTLDPVENEEGSGLRELSRLCKDVGISLNFGEDRTTWSYHHDDECHYPWKST